MVAIAARNRAELDEAAISIAKETNQAAATVVIQNLNKMWARLYAPCRANAVWYINQDVEPALDLLYIPAGTAGLEPRMITYGTVTADKAGVGRGLVNTDWTQVGPRVGAAWRITNKSVLRGGSDSTASLSVTTCLTARPRGSPHSRL